MARVPADRIRDLTQQVMDLLLQPDDLDPEAVLAILTGCIVTCLHHAGPEFRRAAAMTIVDVLLDTADAGGFPSDDSES